RGRAGFFGEDSFVGAEDGAVDRGFADAFAGDASADEAGNGGFDGSGEGNFGGVPADGSGAASSGGGGTGNDGGRGREFVADRVAEFVGERVEIYVGSGKGGNRGRGAAGKRGSGFLCAGQWRGVRRGTCGEVVFAVSAVAWRDGIRGNGDRARHGNADYQPSWRQDLGSGKSGGGRYVLFYSSGCRRR